MSDALARRNEPLPFSALRSLEPDHHYLTRVLGFSRETMLHFGVGFCHKGMMRGQVAIPIHDETGELVAYCGRRAGPGAPSDRFPSGFRKRYAIYNVHRAQATVGPRIEGLIVTRDFTHVWRLFEHGWTNAVALLESTLSLEQLMLIDATVGADRRLTALFDWDDPEFVEALFALHGAFFVRICRPPRERRIVALDHATLRTVLGSPSEATGVNT